MFHMLVTQTPKTPDSAILQSHPDNPPMQRRSIAVLSASHLCADIPQGALPALLPFLIAAHGLRFAQAGGLMFAMSAGSSVVQPLFGYFADRLAKPWLMTAGLLLAGLGISVAGVFSTYPMILLAVAVSGFGVAAFHPEGARLANGAAGKNKATGMSIFSSSGNAGFACGPLLCAGIYLLCGLRGTLLLGLPPIIMAFVLMGQLRRFDSSSGQASTADSKLAAAIPDAWGAFSRLSMLVTLRSIVFYGVITFLPLFWIHVLGQSKAAGSAMLTVFFGLGALGTLSGGRLADRFGKRNILKLGLILLFPMMLIWIHTKSVAMATAMLVPLALIYYAPFSAIVVLGQQYLPNRVAFASGVTLGLAVSIGGVVAPLLGRWADVHGVQSALLWVSVLPLACAILAFTLPAPMKQT